MKNIVQRTITGAIYVATVICAIIFHPIALAIFFGLISMLALYEFYVNSKKANIFTNILGYLLGVTIYSSFALSAFQIDTKYLIIFSIILCFSIFISELYRKKGDAFSNIAYTLLGVIYIVIPMGLTNFVVNPTLSTNSFFPSLLLGVFVIVWSNDTFAYLTGMKFGKNRLFERISPKKSWEGFFGGLVASQLAALVMFYFSNTGLYFFDWMIIGLIVSIIGTFGDLVESMFKRQIDVKDSGNILPGHGGILDRFDILFIAIPFVFSYIFLRLN